MSRLITHLADICRQYVLEEKWLIAPSLRVGHQWLDRATRAGQPVVNVHTRSLRGMVFDLASPEMGSRGLRSVSEMGGTIIVDSILNTIRQEVNAGGKSSDKYFSLLPESFSLSRRIYSSIRDIRLAGLEEKTLAPSAFEKVEKGKEIARILQEYAKHLRAYRLVDYAGAIILAQESAERQSSSFGPPMIILGLDWAELTLLERTFLESIPQRALVDLSPDRVRVSGTETTEEKSDLFRGGAKNSSGTSIGNKALSVFSAIGEVNEIREVFRRCVSDGIPLDEVELLHTDSQTYVPLIYETAQRVKPITGMQADTIVTFDEGIPAKYSRPGKALSAWVSWIRGDFLQSELVKMLEESLVSTGSQGDTVESGLALARALRSVSIGFKRERYITNLEALIQSLEKELDGRVRRSEEDGAPDDKRHHGLRRRLEIARSLFALVRGLLDAAPALQSSQLDILRSAKMFLEKSAAVENDLDDQARRVLISEINEMATLIQRIGRASLDIWDWLAPLASSVRVLGSGPKPGAIHVAGVTSGGHTGRSRTFVVGLDDSRFPGAGLQDPVILDSERTGLSNDLPLAGDQLARKMKRFTDMLEGVAKNVTLSYSCKRIADDSDMFPSPVLSSLGCQTPADGGVNSTESNTPVSFAPSEPDHGFDMTEWWLSKLCAVSQVENPDRLLDRYYPHLARGKQAAAHRESEDFTVYDGRIVASDASLDPTSDQGPVLSARRLQTIGACPRRYFFKHILRIAPPDDVEVDKEAWLSSSDFGTLLHEALYDFVEQRVKIGWPPEYPQDLFVIEEIVRKRAEEWRGTTPPPSDIVFLRRFDQAVQAARVFLEYQSQSRGRRPILLEGSFGMPLDKGGRGSLVTGDPVTLTLPNGKQIRVRGKVDRVDLMGSKLPREVAIIDYKSGFTYSYRSRDPFRQGRVVQHGLYLALWRSVFGSDPAEPSQPMEFVYFFPGETERGLPIVYDGSDLSDWGIVVQKLVEIVASGCFTATNDPKKDCTYCDYTAICGDVGKLKVAMKKKFNKPENKELQPIRELRGREQ